MRTSNPPVRIVAVSDDAIRSMLLDSLLADSSPHDVAVVESLAGAYRCIRELVPDLVVVLMRIDDGVACRLLTMLEVDRELADIPVVTWTIGESECETDYVIGSPASPDDVVMAHA